MSLADAERLTVPEYLALIHHRNAADGDGLGPPDLTPDDLNGMFLKMERAGIAKVLN